MHIKLSLICFLALGLLYTRPMAGYISATAAAGGVLAGRQEAASSKPVYQHESLFINGQKSGFEFNAAYRHSDLADTRYNSYNNGHRLSSAELKYSIPAGLSISGGRLYRPFTDQGLFLDGGSLGYQKAGLLKAEVFGGFQVPSLYQSIFFNTSSQYTAGAASVSILAVPTMELNIHAFKVGEADDGSAGARLDKQFGRSLYITGEGLFDFNISSLSDASLTTNLNLRRADVLRASFIHSAKEADSTRFYIYSINKASNALLVDYYLAAAPHLALSAGYGYISYASSLGHNLKAGAYLYDASLNVESKSNLGARALDVTAGYYINFLKPLSFNTRAGYSNYRLSGSKASNYAYFGGLEAIVNIVKKVNLTAGYDFESNHDYNYDNKVFLNLRYNYYQKL